MGSEDRGRELVACANPGCRVRSRTLRMLAENPLSRQYWPGGLCPSCRDPRDLEETLALLDGDRAARGTERRTGPGSETRERGRRHG